MRELKFRVWITPWGNAEPKSEMIYIGSNELGIYFSNWEHGGYKDAIFQQYTGLKDKNGKEIYEGDIVEIRILNKDDNPDAKIAPDWETVEKYEVYWNTHDCCFMMRNNKTNHRKMPKFIIENVTVVGNIFENKELLNERT